MIQLHTLTGRNGLPDTLETHGARNERTAVLFPSVAHPLPIRLDISGGARAGSRLIGPPQPNHAPAGQDVAICVNASGAGVLVIEESGSDFHGSFVEVHRVPVHASEDIGCRFTPGLSHYRVSFLAVHAASRVTVTSQLVSPVNSTNL